MAIIARWRIPPESSWGKAFALSTERPTSLISSSIRSRRAWRVISGRWAASTSRIWTRRLKTGLRAFMADWNTMASSAQRKSRSSSIGHVQNIDGRPRAWVVKHAAPRDHAGGPQQSRDRVGQGGLPRARLAGYAEHLAASKVRLTPRTAGSGPELSS